MSVNPQPNPNLDTFNNLYWLGGETALTQAEADTRYLRWPVAQGTENLQTTNINGLLTAAAGLSMNGTTINNVGTISGNGLGAPIIIDNDAAASEIRFQIDGTTRCLVGVNGLNLNTNQIDNSNSVNGVNNTNFPIRALGTGHLQLFTGGSGGTNRLTFRDTGECLATSNGLFLSGTTNANSQVRLGYNAAAITQGIGSVSIGGGAGTTQGTNSVAVGQLSGISQGSNAISIGPNSGTSQTNSCIAIGNNAGKGQSASAIAIGTSSGLTTQAASSIAIGNGSGPSQNAGAIAIGLNSGAGTQGSDCVSIGSAAGLNQSNNSVAIGQAAGGTTQGVSSVGIGQAAGQNQGLQCVSIGYFAGKGDGTKTGDNSIAIGTTAGQTSQGQDTVAIGLNAGTGTQRRESVAIGRQAGESNQSTGWVANGDGSVAIGMQSGQSSQSFRSVAIGGLAGQTSQGNSSIAIGYGTGNSSQSTGCVAIGAYAGRNSQKSNSVFIGLNAGDNTSTGLTGTNSIYIGANAGSTVTQSNSIVLSAIGTAYNPTSAGFFVNPVRASAATAQTMYWNTGGELTYLSSSQRYKKDIEDLNEDTSILHNFRPRTFKYIDDIKENISYGFIAEEMAELNPLLAGYNEEGQVESIYWDRINLFNICEVQKLRKEVDEMKSVISTLIEEINILKSR